MGELVKKREGGYFGEGDNGGGHGEYRGYWNVSDGRVMLLFFG